jgi:hypothetical protein
MMEEIEAKLIAAFGVLFVCLALYGAHYIEVKHLKEQITTLTSQRDRAVESAHALAGANDDFALQIAAQNKAKAAYELAASTRAKDIADAVAAAKIEGRREQAKAQTTLQRPMTKPGDACGSLSELLDETIKERS